MAFVPCMARGNRGGTFAATTSGGGGSGGTTADDILALDLAWWFDASTESHNTGTTQAANGESVDNWIDKKNDITTVSPTAGYSPTYYASGENGMPYIHYVQDRMLATHPSTVSTPFTMYWVWSWDDTSLTATNSQTWCSMDTAQYKAGRSWMLASYGPAAWRCGIGTDDTMWPNALTQTTTILEYHATGASGVAEVRKNGGSKLADDGTFDETPADGDLVTSGESRPIPINSGAKGIKLYDSLVIEGVTSDANRNMVNQYFATRYGLTVTDIA